MGKVDKKLGVSGFHTQGFMTVEWLYRDHKIRVIMQGNYNTTGPTKNDIEIYYDGENVTNKYLKPENETAPKRVQTTLDNLITVAKIIDTNIENFIEEDQNE